jgi:hypothetical protein
MDSISRVIDKKDNVSVAYTFPCEGKSSNVLDLLSFSELVVRHEKFLTSTTKQDDPIVSAEHCCTALPTA